MNADRTVAWIGLGTMGGPMAARLVETGFDVVGVDINEAARERALERGVRVVDTNAEAVADADVVVTILPSAPYVRAVFDGENGIWAHCRADALLVDASTVDVETSRWCHEQSTAKRMRFVDAPVSGGVPGAVGGTLTVMLGGEPDDVERARTVFAPLTSRAIDTGGPTNGVAAKICNNMMLFINLVSTCEGAQLADRLGLDPLVFYEIATTSSGRSFPLETWYPVPGVVASAPSNRGFAADFPAVGALKDIELALAAGVLTGIDLPAARLAAGQYQALVDEGLGHLDCSLIVKFTSPDGHVRGFDSEP